MIPLVGAPQHYAWGSFTAIPTALGLEPDGRPWAELWWGTHPGGRTLAQREVADSGVGEAVPLVDVAGHLPYLVKLLAAERPLSLQAHPSAEEAAAGFAHEERAGVPVTAGHRLFRDPYAKPELLIAVTPFDALCGFRPAEDAAAEIEAAGSVEIAGHLRAHGSLATVAWLLRERPAISVDHPRFRRLAAEYPGDPGALVALLLHEVHLTPGEALYVDTGVLHSYLGGIALEVMGASDNVMRGGLTAKHIDVDALIGILTPHSYVPAVLRPDVDGWYATPTTTFAVQGLIGATAWTATGPEIVVRLSGSGDTAAWFAPSGTEVRWDDGLGCRIVSPGRIAAG